MDRLECDSYLKVCMVMLKEVDKFAQPQLLVNIGCFPDNERVDHRCS